MGLASDLGFVLDPKTGKKLIPTPSTLVPQSEEASEELDASHGRNRLIADKVDRLAKIEGRRNADFFQGTKQNLAGIRNQANNANAGADLGQALTTANAAASLEGEAENLEQTSRNASIGAQTHAMGNKAQLSKDQGQFNKDVADAQNEVLVDNSKWQMIDNAISGAVAGFTARDSVENWLRTEDADGLTDWMQQDNKFGWLQKFGKFLDKNFQPEGLDFDGAEDSAIAEAVTGTQETRSGGQIDPTDLATTPAKAYYSSLAG